MCGTKHEFTARSKINCRFALLARSDQINEHNERVWIHNVVRIDRLNTLRLIIIIRNARCLEFFHFTNQSESSILNLTISDASNWIPFVCIHWSRLFVRACSYSSGFHPALFTQTRDYTMDNTRNISIEIELYFWFLVLAEREANKQNA